MNRRIAGITKGVEAACALLLSVVGHVGDAKCFFKSSRWMTVCGGDGCCGE